VTAAVIRIVAAVVLDERGRVLVVRKRGTTSFMQPGGKIEPGEVPLAALTREVREELGTGIAASGVRALGRHTAEAANEPGHLVDADLFLVELDGEPRAAAEIDELAWIDPDAPEGVELAPLTAQTVFGLLRDGVS
jgi:8-oxo-dGTP pyrophosphatase MutT (NUDIX family)